MPSENWLSGTGLTIKVRILKRTSNEKYIRKKISDHFNVDYYHPPISGTEYFRVYI